MVSPHFPYKTYIDRVITNEHYEIIFGEKAGNVYDSISDHNQQEIISKLETQINHLNTQIANQNEQIQKQEQQIEKMITQIEKQNEQITLQQTNIQLLQNVVDKLDEQIIKHNELVETQYEIYERLNEDFHVIIQEHRMELYGNSTDSKPTDVKIGTVFFEYDTGDVYMFTGTGWVQI